MVSSFVACFLIHFPIVCLKLFFLRTIGGATCQLPMTDGLVGKNCSNTRKYLSSSKQVVKVTLA